MIETKSLLLKTGIEFKDKDKPSPDVEDDIYTQYQHIDQVQAIYGQDLPEVYNVYVLLNHDRYDEALMDRLLDQEEFVLDLHPDSFLQFYYLPILENNIPQVPKNSVRILSR